MLGPLGSAISTTRSASSGICRSQFGAEGLVFIGTHNVFSNHGRMVDYHLYASQLKFLTTLTGYQFILRSRPGRFRQMRRITRRLNGFRLSFFVVFFSYCQGNGSPIAASQVALIVCRRR